MKSTYYTLKYHCANMATSTGRENAKKPGICIDYAEWVKFVIGRMILTNQ